MLHKPWEVVGVDIFTTKTNKLLCIGDYYRKFPVVKKADGLSADNLIRLVKNVVTEFGLPMKIMSDVGTNFMSDKCWEFCRQMTMEQAVTSSYHQQSSAQVDVCTKLMKCTIKIFLDNDDFNLALLQMRFTPIGAELPSLTTLLFKRPIRALLPQISSEPITLMLTMTSMRP